MAEYLIRCVTKSARTSAGHQHIASVGVGGQRHTVAQIYQFMDAGYTFRTVSPSSGKEAPVGKYRCCGLDTLRSYSDGYWDNNLDNLPRCP
jgi:Protein of unknown function (DUF3892)